MAKRLSYDDILMLNDIKSSFGLNEFTTEEFCKGTDHNPRRIGAIFKGMCNRGAIDRVRKDNLQNHRSVNVYKISDVGIKALS